MSFQLTEQDLKLSEEVANYYADPLGFVLFAFPWGEPGPLKAYTGPDKWQREALLYLGQQVRDRNFNGVEAVRAIRMAISSGHGIGKGTLASWIACWILSTRPDSQGTITANTAGQLSTKTWAALKRWLKLCITGHWFDIGAEKVRHKLFPDSWFVSAITCKEENSESFAGQHAANSTSWYLFDEASAIPDVIGEVAEGGLTDGEPMFFMFGNPTRNTGMFYRACFGADRVKWNAKIIDSRDCQFTNKELLNGWVEEYGEDSDFVRVRVRGLAPRASDAQFIGQDVVFLAQNREGVKALEDEPLVAGLDIARGGLDNCVVRFRRGPLANEVVPIKIPGEEARDSMRLVSVASDLMGKEFRCGDGVMRRIGMLFVDGTGVGGPVYDRLSQLGYEDRVTEVGFGKRSPDDKFDNMRAYMWGKMRDWLARGVIDKDPQLAADLVAPGYGHSKRDKLLLESKESLKKRGEASTDDGDALALTFAATVVKKSVQMTSNYRPPMVIGGQANLDWMG